MEVVFAHLQVSLAVAYHVLWKSSEPLRTKLLSPLCLPQSLCLMRGPHDLFSETGNMFQLMTVFQSLPF